MAKVNFTYGKGGKTVQMAERYAQTLVKLGRGTYQTRALQAAPPSAPVDDEPRVTAAVAQFAEENGVDLDEVVGTGKDGRIKKSDVEAVIAARTPDQE